MNKKHMTKTDKTILIASLLTLSAVSADAQVDESGKRVKRITFDREQVTLVYNDGSKSENVQETVIVKDGVVTGIKEMDQTEKSAARPKWYAIDGRKLPKEPNSPAGGKGIYVVRENDKVRKIIKK